jgi:hypothetical protein
VSVVLSSPRTHVDRLMPSYMLSSTTFKICSQSLSEKVTVSVVPVDTSDVLSIQAARSSITGAIEKATNAAPAASSISGVLSSAWAEIPAGIPRAALTPVRS